MSRYLSSAAQAVKDATQRLRAPRRSNSDLEPLRNEEQEGYGVFDLRLGMRELLYKVTGRDNFALTVMAVANRVEPIEARLLFLWLYGERDGTKLRDLATTMYNRIVWPTETGAVDPRVGISICISMLLRHYWFRNGDDYDKRHRPLSPTMMSRMLGLKLSKGKAPQQFHNFQRTVVFPLLSQWELAADNQISDELSEKGLFRGYE